MKAGAPPPTPGTLPGSWRQAAEHFRAHSCESAARAYEVCAEELENSLARARDELLDLKQASELSGYSVDHLGRLVRDGRLPNRGRPGAPRVARGDLPVKPGRAPAPLPMAQDLGEHQFSRAQIVRSAINRGVG